MIAGVPLGRCRHCGAAYFPARLLCARCGRADWESSTATDGVVEETTTVHRSVGAQEPGPAHLATVRLAEGPRIVIRSDQPLTVGSTVRLEHADGVVSGRPG